MFLAEGCENEFLPFYFNYFWRFAMLAGLLCLFRAACLSAADGSLGLNIKRSLPMRWSDLVSGFGF